MRRITLPMIWKELNMRQRHLIELFNDYDYEIRYHPGKANVVADVLSIKERIKSKRIRAMNMTIQSSIKDKILAAQNKASEVVNAPAEMLRGLDYQMEQHKRPSGLLQQPKILEWKWERIVINFITKLPRTGNGHDAIWVIVDWLTKSAYFLPIHKDFKMDMLARLYLNEIIARHEMPISIIFDRDSRFTSRFWQSMQKALGTQLDMSTDYHPQTDGQSEHTIQTLEDMLKAYVMDFGGSWDVYHPFVEFSYNNNYHSSVRCAPFEALYGRKCRLAILWAEVREEQLTGPELVQETIEKISQIKDRLKAARDRQKSYADQHRKPLEFSAGDHVLLKVSPCILYRVDGDGFCENYDELRFIVINNPFWKVRRGIRKTDTRYVSLSDCDSPDFDSSHHTAKRVDGTGMGGTWHITAITVVGISCIGAGISVKLVDVWSDMYEAIMWEVGHTEWSGEFELRTNMSLDERQCVEVQSGYWGLQEGKHIGSLQRYGGLHGGYVLGVGSIYGGGCEEGDSKDIRTVDVCGGDHVLLKVSPWKGADRFGKKGKLAPRYVGPFEITERIGLIAYRLRLPQELNGVHDMFHVSNLKKCLVDPTLQIPLDDIQVDAKLNFVEEPVEILKRESKKLKWSRIAIVKDGREGERLGDQAGSGRNGQGSGRGSQGGGQNGQESDQGSQGSNQGNRANGGGGGVPDF
ncbi:putative reverse transcriptase domain-containing protein [Tanacetum coccineum]